MLPGMQCILEVLRGQGGNRLVCEAEWQSALALAEEQHVLPILADRLLRRSDLVLPPAIRTRLARAEREAVQYGFLQISELKELLRAFAEAKVAVLPLKGPSLAERVYGRAGLRVSRDLDLLVRKPDFAAGGLLLCGLRFQPLGRADDYHQTFQRGTTVVELHFDVEHPLALDFDVRGAWENASLADFGGQPAWRLTPEDELLYLCLHGVRHRFERMSLVVDIAFSLQKLALQRGSEQSFRTGASDARRLLMLGRLIARRFDGAEPLVGVGDKELLRMDALAGRLWSDLLSRRARQMDWQSMHAFYLELEGTRWRKLRRRIMHWRILMTRLIEVDYAFAARFGFGRRWQVWLLRPLRLLTLRWGASAKRDSGLQKT